MKDVLRDDEDEDPIHTISISKHPRSVSLSILELDQATKGSTCAYCQMIRLVTEVLLEAEILVSSFHTEGRIPTSQVGYSRKLLRLQKMPMVATRLEYGQ